MSQDAVKRKVIILDNDEAHEKKQTDESKKLKLSEPVKQKAGEEENDFVLLRDYSLLPQEILTVIFKYLSIKERCQMAR
jgi:hypothetical protein